MKCLVYLYTKHIRITRLRWTAFDLKECVLFHCPLLMFLFESDMHIFVYIQTYIYVYIYIVYPYAMYVWRQKQKINQSMLRAVNVTFYSDGFFVFGAKNQSEYVQSMLRAVDVTFFVHIHTYIYLHIHRVSDINCP